MVLLFTQPDTDHWKSNRFQVPAPSGSVLFWRNGVGSNVFGGPTLRSDKKPRRKDGLQALTVPPIPLDLTSFISIVRLRRGLAPPVAAKRTGEPVRSIGAGRNRWLEGG